MNMGEDAPAIVEQRARNLCADTLSGASDDRSAGACHRTIIASLGVR
jgi:hypothetical protein